jgi:hypothetical protein
VIKEHKPPFTRDEASDRRITRGDHYAGDAWTDANGARFYVTVGFDPNNPGADRAET